MLRKRKPEPVGEPANHYDKGYSRIAEIQEAARELILSQGYDATTLEQIARKVGVTKGSFFNYYRSKAHLCAEMSAEWYGQWWLSGIVAMGAGPLEEAVAQMNRAWLQWVDRHPKETQWLLCGFSFGLQGHEQQVRFQEHAARKAFAAWWKARMAAKEVPKLDVALAEALVCGPVRELVRIHDGKLTRAEREAAVEVLTERVLRSLGSK